MLENTASVFLGNGDGSFRTPAPISLVTSAESSPNPRSATLAVLRTGAKPDLLLANAGTGQGDLGGVGVLLNNGSGSFQAPISYPAGTSPAAVAAADFNGDGNMDTVVATGSATVAVISGDGTQTTGTVEIAPVAPGLFTLNSSGLAAAYAICVAGTQQTIEEVFQTVNGAITPLALNLEGCDQTVLVLYGTGLRGAAGSVQTTFNGVNATVHFTGPQGAFAGLDQVNVTIPQNAGLTGDVTIQVTADGLAANPVQITVE